MTCRRFIVSIGAMALCVLACCPDVHGVEPERVLGLHSVELAPPSARSDLAIAVASTSVERRLPSGSEAPFREPTIWERYRLQALAVCAALLMQAGLISLLVYEHRSRERAELVSRKSAAELARMNRLAAAGELSASIAHEVSQPLTGISARASAALHWLSAEEPDVAKIRGALNDIVNATHRAADVISNIRLTLKKGEKAKRPVHINDLIQVVLSIVQADLNKEGVELRLDLDTSIEILEVDGTQLQQVILNLITNAVEAMHSVQSRILTISTRQAMPGIVRMSIEDTGPGVDREDTDRIFDRLFTTKPSGMGMGLSICRSIVERHHGHIWVAKGVNGGAIFQIELPSIRRAVASASMLTRSLVTST